MCNGVIVRSLLFLSSVCSKNVRSAAILNWEVIIFFNRYRSRRFILRTILMKLGQNMSNHNIKNPIDFGSFTAKNGPLAAILNYQI